MSELIGKQRVSALGTTGPLSALCGLLEVPHRLDAKLPVLTGFKWGGMASDTGPKTPSKWTREEFYTQVWEARMDAKEFLNNPLLTIHHVIGI